MLQFSEIFRQILINTNKTVIFLTDLKSYQTIPLFSELIYKQNFRTHFCSKKRNIVHGVLAFEPNSLLIGFYFAPFQYRYT